MLQIKSCGADLSLRSQFLARPSKLKISYRLSVSNTYSSFQYYRIESIQLQILIGSADIIDISDNMYNIGVNRIHCINITPILVNLGGTLTERFIVNVFTLILFAYFMLIHLYIDIFVSTFHNIDIINIIEESRSLLLQLLILVC